MNRPIHFDLQPTLVGDLVTLRPLRPDDFDALYAVAADPGIWEQHPAPNRYEETQFREFFRDALASGGALLALDQATSEVIGSSRYHGYDPTRREVEIGWTFLARSHWGGCYNGEMKRLMLNHAFRFVDRVVFLVGPQNVRSQRAVERIGGQRVGVRPDGAGRDRLVYEITGSAYASALESPGCGPISTMQVLIVPGYTNSGPGHWQSLWQVGHHEYRRVEQQDWDAPEISLWVEALLREVRAADVPVVLVAHSLGCIAVAHWVASHSGETTRAAGALLVAPADVERPDAPEVLRAFGPVPLVRFPFPSVVVASTTDPSVSIDRAQSFAAAWGARFIDVGDAGHLNTAAGFGPWPEGEQILADLISSLALHARSR